MCCFEGGKELMDIKIALRSAHLPSCILQPGEFPPEILLLSPAPCSWVTLVGLPKTISRSGPGVLFNHFFTHRMRDHCRGRQQPVSAHRTTRRLKIPLQPLPACLQRLGFFRPQLRENEGSECAETGAGSAADVFLFIPSL